MNSAGRKQAPRLARPAARYWKGKAPKGVAEVESDSDEENDAGQEIDEGDVSVQDIAVDGDEEDDLKIQTQNNKSVKAVNVTLKDVNISKDGRVIVAGREESGRTALEAPARGADSEEESESEDEEEEEEEAPKAEAGESSEYETDSEEEAPKPQFRPVFVPKRNRATVEEAKAIAQDTEEALRKRELEVEERRKQSHDLVAESIRRELAEKEKADDVPEIDDTDGLDPTAEFEAWRLREMSRIKRDKEAEIRREQEREEVERRRALPEEQRLKEDLERAQKSREKPKGQQKFLQKYWHKGAFHQDEEILKRHDFTEATESTFDVSALPKVMQVRNFGKRSRTKYTHLVDQDTTQTGSNFGGVGAIKAGGKLIESGGCFVCGGPHLKADCPQRAAPSHRSSTDTGWTSRQSGNNGKSREDYESRGHSGGSDRRDDNRRSYNRRYSRSRSRSPRSSSAYREYERHDKRPRERSVDPDSRGKRRRHLDD